MKRNWQLQLLVYRKSLLICFRLKCDRRSTVVICLTYFMRVLSNHGARGMTKFKLDRSKDRSACPLHNMDIV